MRLICPHCRLLVTIADSTAGRLAPCPSCHEPITVPSLTGATIDAAPEPVPIPEPEPPGNPAALGTPFSKREGGEKTKEPVGSSPPSRSGKGDAGLGSSSAPAAGAPWLRLTIRRDVAHWLAPVSLVVAFVLTLFTWVAVAPNGTRIYTQNAWQAASGALTADPVGDAVMNAEKDLQSATHWNPWLWFYLILLILSAAIAVADRVLASNPMVIPDVLRVIWPHRQLIVAALTAALFLLLLAPFVFGFGLETAVAQVAATTSQPPAGQTPPTTKEKTDQDLRRDVAIARFGVHRTGWLYLAVMAQVVALVGAGLARWLDRHPHMPEPRIEVYC